MRRFAPFIFPILMAACASETAKTGGEEEVEATEPREAEVRPSDLPPGTIHRTSRTASFLKMCEELAGADVVYIGNAPSDASHHALELQIIRQLHARGRLEAIGIDLLERSLQDSLNDYTRGRIDEATLLERVEWNDRTQVDFALYRPIFAFAREHRIDIVALDVDRRILELMMSGGPSAISEEQRRSLPALDSDSDLSSLRANVMADTIVRWFDAVPSGAQMVVLAEAGLIRNRSGIPDRARKRRGGSHRTLVMLDGNAPNPRSFAHAHADFVFVPQR